MKYLLIVFALLIQGCSSTHDPRSSAEKKRWDNAYDNAIFILAKNKKDDADRIIALTKEYPEIINYGYSTFSEENLKNWADKDNMIAYQKYSLEYFCIISSDEQCETATNNLDTVVKTIKKKITVLEDLYQKLTPKEQKSLSDKYRLDFYKSSEIGTITDRQIQNLSTPGSNAGAEVGGAIGATAYINNATPSSYSMKSDIASTVLGALAGAVLLNKNPTVQYLIRYTIKLRNGEIIQVDQISSAPLGQGVGMCISASNASPIDQSYCVMTLDEFRLKYSEEIKS